MVGLIEHAGQVRYTADKKFKFLNCNGCKDMIKICFVGISITVCAFHTGIDKQSYVDAVNSGQDIPFTCVQCRVILESSHLVGDEQWMQVDEISAIENAGISELHAIDCETKIIYGKEEAEGSPRHRSALSSVSDSERRDRSTG